MSKKNIISKDYLKELASDIMLELSAEELSSIHVIEKEIKTKFASVLKINTDGIEPLNYPFEKPHHLLRTDEEVSVVPQSSVLANAPATKDEFIVLTKVIK